MLYIVQSPSYVVLKWFKSHKPTRFHTVIFCTLYIYVESGTIANSVLLARPDNKWEVIRGLIISVINSNENHYFSTKAKNDTSSKRDQKRGQIMLFNKSFSLQFVREPATRRHGNMKGKDTKGEHFL